MKSYFSTLILAFLLLSIFSCEKASVIQTGQFSSLGKIEAMENSKSGEKVDFKFLTEIPEEIRMFKNLYQLVVANENGIVSQQYISLNNNNVSAILSLNPGKYDFTLNVFSCDPYFEGSSKVCMEEPPDAKINPINPDYTGTTAAAIEFSKISTINIWLHKVEDPRDVNVIGFVVKLPKANAFFFSRMVMEVSANVAYIMEAGADQQSIVEPCYYDQANDATSDFRCYPQPYVSVEMNIDTETGMAYGKVEWPYNFDEINITLTAYDKNGTESFSSKKEAVLKADYTEITFEASELKALSGAFKIKAHYCPEISADQADSCIVPLPAETNLPD